jgi:hypothetical protein
VPTKLLFQVAGGLRRNSGSAIIAVLALEAGFLVALARSDKLIVRYQKGQTEHVSPHRARFRIIEFLSEPAASAREAVSLADAAGSDRR